MSFLSAYEVKNINYKNIFKRTFKVTNNGVLVSFQRYSRFCWERDDIIFYCLSTKIYHKIKNTLGILNWCCTNNVVTWVIDRDLQLKWLHRETNDYFICCYMYAEKLDLTVKLMSSNPKWIKSWKKWKQYALWYL